MQINWDKLKSYAKTGWSYYARWAFFRRHMTMFYWYLGTVGAITYGISGFRLKINHNPDTESFFEVISGSIGWPEFGIIVLVTIAFIFITCLMERKSFLAQADADYKDKLDALFDSRMFPIRKLYGFINTFNNKGPFINGDNKDIQNVFVRLREVIDGKIDNLYISAFSGMGKTRWVCEVFKDIKPGEPVYYCDKVDEARFETSFSALIEENVGKEVIIILDDCDAVIYDRCLLKIQQSNSLVRLIGLNNDPSRTPQGVKLISFDYQDLSDVVRAIVDERLSPKLKDVYGNTIIEYAEGIPYMAVLLIEGLNKDNEPNPRNLSRNALCERMIHWDPSISKESQMKAFQTISLFSPLGYENKDDDQLSFVRDNDNITPLVGPVNRKNLFNQVVGSGINQQIIEKRSTWINVRPSVLAVWLLEDWYKLCDDRRMKAVAHDLVNAPFGKLLIEAFGKRFSDMPESPSAQKLVAEITELGGSFRSEDVVCSDMGSRLFLAMATVNPVAVSECLHACLFFKDIGWLKEYIKDDVRRNYVWALEKLCFRRESFNKSAQLLAKLAVAENEMWGNNATGNFCQLFHVALAGTQATPTERIKLLKELSALGEEYNDVVILALNHIFNYGHFHRTGGAEKVGKKSLPEFNPNGKDILDYWNMACDFTEEWLSTHSYLVDKVAEAIAKQARQIGWAAGCRNILYRLIDIVVKIRGNDWPEMAKELTFADIHHSGMLSDEEKDVLHKMIDKLKSKDFISILDEAHMRFYGDYSDFDQKEKEAESYFAPYVNSFVSQELYDDIDVITKLMDNSRQCDIFFIIQLAHALNEEQLKRMFNTAISVFQKDKINGSSFINLVCAHSQSVEAVDCFLTALKDNEMKSEYVSIISGREKKDLHILHSLYNEYGGASDWDSLLSDYLRRAPLYDGEQMANTCTFLMSKMGDNADACIADYIGSHSYLDIIKTEPMLSLVEGFLLKVNDDRLSPNTIYEMNNLAERLLKDRELPDFARQYNFNIIKKASTVRVSSDYDTIYFSLLPKYENTILNDVLNALADENGAFWLQMMNHLGSGFSSDKGEGPLFQCNHTSIKDFCLQHAKSDFPQRLAHMCPVYEYNGNNSENKFHEFVYWFLENLDRFNDGKAVLSGLGANMNSFSWTGSTIPLWEKQKDCFTRLLNHKNPLVRDWAKRNIETLDLEIKNDQRKESYEYFRYKS